MQNTVNSRKTASAHFGMPLSKLYYLYKGIFSFALTHRIKISPNIKSGTSHITYELIGICNQFLSNRDNKNQVGPGIKAIPLHLIL